MKQKTIVLKKYLLQNEMVYYIRFLEFSGKVAEWLKAHDWNSCSGHKPLEGLNPSLSAIYSLEKIANFKIINRIKYLTTRTTLHKSAENISKYFWVFQNFTTFCYNFCYTQFSGTENQLGFAPKKKSNYRGRRFGGLQ